MLQKALHLVEKKDLLRGVAFPHLRPHVQQWREGGEEELGTGGYETDDAVAERLVVCEHAPQDVWRRQGVPRPCVTSRRGR